MLISKSGKCPLHWPITPTYSAHLCFQGRQVWPSTFYVFICVPLLLFFIFQTNILCACSCYLEYLHILSWDCNGIGFGEIFYCERVISLVLMRQLKGTCFFFFFQILHVCYFGLIFINCLIIKIFLFTVTHHSNCYCMWTWISHGKKYGKYFKLIKQTVLFLTPNSVICTYWAGPDMQGLHHWNSLWVWVMQCLQDWQVWADFMWPKPSDLKAVHPSFHWSFEMYTF